MAPTDPILLDLPMPIQTPRLLIRPKQPGDGAETSLAVHETWVDLHQWMDWADRLEDHTPEKAEIRTRQVMAKFILREEFNLLGIELATGQPVIWCGFHSVDWNARQCDTGYWVRKSAQGKGFATESTNALLRYAFGALGMRRVGLTHSEGNDRSRRVAEKLGFTPEGVHRSGALLPGGRSADKLLYARLNLNDLPPLDVHWGPLNQAGQGSSPTPGDPLAAHLHALEQRLLDPGFRKNQQAVASLLTDDFREFGSSGTVFTKQAILAHLANEVPPQLTLNDFKGQQLGETCALVTFRSHRHSPEGTSVSALRSSLWVRRPEGWKLHFHQGTRT